MPDALLSVALLLIGGFLGFISSIALSIAQKRHQVTLRLLDQYLDVRSEVVDAVSNLTHLPLGIKLEPSKIEHHRDLIAKLYYKNYDFLPQPVLDELLLLHVALERNEGQLYTLKGRSIILLPENETPKFIEECCAYDNAALIATLVLGSQDLMARRNQCLKLHARRVLHTFNTYSSMTKLHKVTSEFYKNKR